MYICLYIPIYMCTYVYMCPYMCIWTYVYIYMFIYTYTSIFIYVYCPVFQVRFLWRTRTQEAVDEAEGEAERGDHGWDDVILTVDLKSAGLHHSQVGRDHVWTERHPREVRAGVVVRLLCFVHGRREAAETSRGRPWEEENPGGWTADRRFPVEHLSKRQQKKVILLLNSFFCFPF